MIFPPVLNILVAFLLFQYSPLSITLDFSVVNFTCYFISSCISDLNFSVFSFTVLIIFLLQLHTHLSRISDDTLVSTNPSSKTWSTFLQRNSCPCILTLYFLPFIQFLIHERTSPLMLWQFGFHESVSWDTLSQVLNGNHFNVSYQELEYSYRISNLWKRIFDFWRRRKRIVYHL